MQNNHAVTCVWPFCGFALEGLKKKLKTYFWNRPQRVVWNGQTSSWRPILAGVFQSPFHHFSYIMISLYLFCPSHWRYCNWGTEDFMLYLFFVFACYRKKANGVNVLCSPLLICLFAYYLFFSFSCSMKILSVGMRLCDGAFVLVIRN